MKLKSILNLCLAILLLTVGLGWLTPAQPVRAAAGVYYVAPGGSDSADCASPSSPCATINGAIGKAAAGDTIQVAVGMFTNHMDNGYVVSSNKSMNLSGGWDVTFTEQSGFSIIDGENTRAGLYVSGGFLTIVTIDHFVIQNGKTAGEGGGIFNDGILTLTNSLITHNFAQVNGGGINNYIQGRLTIKNSSISFNSTPGNGGGIFSNARLYMSNSTISGNSALAGGGIYNDNNVYDNSAFLYSTTIVNNTGINSGGGIWSFLSVYIKNTILAYNGGQTTSPNCSSWLISHGYNLIQDVSGCQIGGILTGNILGVDPKLLSFVDGAGYYPLSSTSPAIDTGDPTGCKDPQSNLLTTDQRGAPRIGRCDIGAYEYTVPGPAASLAITAGSPQTTRLGQPFPAPLQVRAFDNLGSPVGGAEVNFFAPLDGASGTFQDNGSSSITSETDEGGFTSPLVFRANAAPGTYTVSANTDGVETPVNFLLTNLAQIFLPMIAKH